MRSTGVVTSPCGSTRRFSPRSSGRRSNRCAEPEARTAPFRRCPMPRLRRLSPFPEQENVMSGLHSLLSRGRLLATPTVVGAIGLLLPAVAAYAEPAPAPGEVETISRPPAAANPVVTAASDAAVAVAQPRGDTSIRPFLFRASDEAVAELRRRIAATQWPEQETVNDSSQGVRLATMRELARYWATDYDWRKGEEKLNAFPQFITNIDGLEIHFIHVRS